MASDAQPHAYQQLPLEAVRLCPACDRSEAIAPDEPVWRTGWRCSACGHSVEVRGGIPVYAPDLANSDTGFDATVFNLLAQHEEGHFWFEPRSRLLTGLAAKFFPASRHYLEIGCGTGVVLRAMATSRSWVRIAGSELHPEGLVHAVRRLGPTAEFVQFDARHIPARRAFDLVGAFDVLEHIAEDVDVIGEAFNALMPGGGFIASVPQHPALWSEADEAAHHVRRYRRGELESKLSSTGFQVLFSTSYTCLVVPLMALSRLRMRRPHADDNGVVHELSINPLANKALLRLLDFEVKLTLKGVVWPIGGSRVVVALKPQGLD